MKRDQSEDGRLSDHSSGLGTVTHEMVRRRAREIAIINGREDNRILDSDMEQARRELQGQERLYPVPTAAENLPESERWNPVASTRGHQTRNVPVPDEQTVTEKLVEEGVAEAEHDQQVAAVREGRRQDSLS